MAERQTGSALFYGDAVSATGSTQLYPLGTRREEEGKTFRYVKYDDAAGDVTAVADRVCGHLKGSATDASPTAWNVTMDTSDSAPNACAGVLQAVIATGEYGWILTRGIAKLTTDGGDDIILGDALVWDAADTGVVDRPAAYSTSGLLERPVAIALQADNDAGDYVYAFVCCD